MLSARTGTILNSIVGHYIAQAIPVPSQYIAGETELKVSPATIRNEMARLEQEEYIVRPHTSAGSIPTDKGYRYYVDSLENIQLPLTKQRLISHTFHQVEEEIDKWLSLTATLLAQLVQNVAVVSKPKSAGCKLKHMELVNLQESLALLVLVLYGAQVKQRLMTFDQIVPQSRLTAIANKLNEAYSGLTRQQIAAKDTELLSIEQQITDHLIETMQDEDEQEYEEPYLDGLYFILSQPEFAYSDRTLTLMELVEHRSLLKTIVPERMSRHAVHVVIGKENKAEAIQNYSVVISQYGIPDKASGTIGVVGPTRMPYYNTITTVGYLAAVLSGLVTGLYEREAPAG